MLWLLALGVLFFSSYNAANWLASQRAQVPSIVFAWETHVPFWPWTIVPYWSIDLFYCVSLFVCRTRAELTTQAMRLLTVQVISVAVFVLAPLKCTFVRPETTGVFGAMFDALQTFDKPFNQAPALHISLLIILWVCFARHLHGPWRWLLHVWFALIGISVMTTYQHHFFDIPTGAWTGFLCVWLFPHGKPSLVRMAVLTKDPRRRTLALRYLGGGLIAGAVAVLTGGWALWLLWPAASLLLVAAIYAVVGAVGFQKDGQGSMSLASRALLAPYLAGAWLNSRWWTRHAPAPRAVTPMVWLGRLPAADDELPHGVTGVVDLCGELPSRVTVTSYAHVPALDLVTLTPTQLRDAAQAITAAVAHGPVLVCCALGYSRSAAAVAAWLLVSGQAGSPGAALDLIRLANRDMVISPLQYAALQELAA
jgi:hypothetical protein